MMKLRVFIPLILIISAACSTGRYGDRYAMIYDEKLNQMTLREEIPSPNSSDEVIEVLWAKPKSNPPTAEGYPTLVLIHPHQEPARPGGKEWVRAGVIAKFASEGILTAAVSLPGYGSSTGPADFSGERSTSVVKAVIEFLKQNGAKPGQVALWGMGQGATVAAHSAHQNPDICGLVLLSPILDPPGFLSRLKTKGDVLSQKVASEMELEGVKEDPTQSSSTSVLAIAPQIDAPVFYVGGAKDEWIDADRASELSQVITASGGWASVKVFSEYGSNIPTDTQNSLIYPFLGSVLK